MATITLTDGAKRQLPPSAGIAGSNCGVAGVWRFEATAPGPHVVLSALIHGNEVSGAHALWELLQSGPNPARGKLTLVFCNLDAYARLDDATKDDCRFVDEDLNRVWGRVDAPASGQETYELRRAREILPWVGDADWLLDLHSMTGEAPALGLVGMTQKNVDFAKQLGAPALLVRDAGHAAGLRLIDRTPFADAAAPQVAMLVECGQHFSPAAFDAAQDLVRRVMARLGGAAVDAAPPQTLIEVTQAVTIRTDAFEFAEDWANMAVVPRAGTLIGRDGAEEVRAPHDHTYLVMPASPRHRKPGLTAVRFGRRVP